MDHQPSTCEVYEIGPGLTVWCATKVGSKKFRLVRAGSDRIDL
jgi:hypothetical protein